MACRGVHFALTNDQRAQLLSIVESQGDVIGYIQEDVEEQWDTDWLCETDKASVQRRSVIRNITPVD